MRLSQGPAESKRSFWDPEPDLLVMYRCNVVVLLPASFCLSSPLLYTGEMEAILPGVAQH